MKYYSSENVFKVLNDTYYSVQSYRGDEYLKHLVKNLAENLEMDYAYIAYPLPNLPMEVRSAFTWFNGKFVDDFQYHLANSPCEKMIDSERVCIFPSSVQSTFPKDIDLSSLEVESYIGSPIFSSSGDAIGILVLMSKNPVEDVDTYRSICEFFANMIGVEITRKVADEKLLKINSELEEKVKIVTEEMRQKERILFEQEKLAALGRVISGVAHEIRNPLNLIINAGEIMRDVLGELHSSNKQKSNEDRETITSLLNLTEILNTQGARLRKVITSMLRHRKEVIVRSKVQLKSLISESFDYAFHASLLKRQGLSFEFIKEFPEEDVALELTDDVQSLFLNLFENALTSLCDKYGEVDGNGIIKVKLESHKDNIIIEVYDNGMGIPAENISKIYEPFFTTKAPSEGTGLGLSLVKTIIEQNFGQLELDSAEGEFTKFIISLPITGENLESKN